ncbi:uncharacterized protein LOC114310469 [Camellia sinensis]|uniref:uncharacterized protein LOC114310469 n=1 Tax=Camellia sinensis TaxID=4442 RepID=UPI0010355972|nr:uncharacterized protein LOC114310469 [Camellia sinensis]
MVGGSGCHVVDVIVGDKRVVEVDDGNSYRIDSVTCESSFVNDCDDVGGLLRSFYPEPKRVLLSASWKGIIHSVGQEFEGGVSGFRIALAKSCSKMVGSKLVSDIVQNDISDNPLTRPIEVKKKLKKQYGIDVSYRVAWLGVDKLRWYLETALRTNPGSVFELDVDESSGCFRRLFVAFHGCLYGFQFCRPLLFVDGTFLKGHLLAATSKDGNQGLFPLAFAIVDAENQDNWIWFLSQLLKAVGSSRRLTFVSDRQHGLLDALSVVFPNAHHAYCLNHLKRNLIDKLVGLCTNYKLCLMKILVKCAYAPTVASFQHYMEKLRRIVGNGKVDSMLDGLQNDKWANAFFRGKRYGEMSSNAAESYNNWIGGARELPITCMVDMIRVQIVTQLSN